MQIAQALVRLPALCGIIRQSPSFVLRSSYTYYFTLEKYIFGNMDSTTKASRKRQAPVRAGPKKTKKAHMENSEKHSTDVTALQRGKKRSQPVTRPIQESDDSDLEVTDEGEPGDAELAQDEHSEDEAPGSREASTKDPNGTYTVTGIDDSLTGLPSIAARESHKAQRALLNERRAAKPHSALLAEAKRAWLLAHQKNISKAEREKYLHALMDVIRGNVKDIVLKHDASRIVQTVVRYGGEKERNEVAEELKGRYRELAQSKYSKVRLAWYIPHLQG